MDYSWIVMLVLMFGMLYFFMIRPENKRKKEAENLRNSLAVGDEITTIGGMTGHRVRGEGEHHRVRDRR